VGGRRGGACVPIASGDLGVWVAKQRQLKRKGKLSAGREARLQAVGFVWDTAAADWEEKFSALMRWKAENGGDTRVPFNSPGEDGLGWWVATQRQARRKGKMGDERRERLDSIGFCWNPTETPRRGRVAGGPAAPATQFGGGEAAGDVGGAALPAMRVARRTSNKRRADELGVVASKRHHSFTGDAASTGYFGEPDSFGSAPASGGGPASYSWGEQATVRRAASFGPLTGDAFTLPQAGHGSGSSTPASGSVRTFSGTGGELAGNAGVGVGEVQLAPLLFNGPDRGAGVRGSLSAPSSGTGAFLFGHPPPAPLLPPVSSLSPITPQSHEHRDPVWHRCAGGPLARRDDDGGADGRARRAESAAMEDCYAPEPVPFGRTRGARRDLEPYVNSGTSWSTTPAPHERSGYARPAAEALADLARLAVSTDHRRYEDDREEDEDDEDDDDDEDEDEDDEGEECRNEYRSPVRRHEYTAECLPSMMRPLPTRPSRIGE
jgi:hypothetical protein